MNFLSRTQHVGININDASIELISLDDAEHIQRITQHARVELGTGSIVRGSILDEERVRAALRKIKEMIGLTKKARLRATLSVSEYLVFPFSIKVSDIPRSQRKAYIQDEATKRVPMHPDEQASFVVKESLDAERMVVYVLNRHIIQYYQEILGKENIEIDYIEPESVAIARFVLPAAHKEERTYICDIGHTTSTVITLSYGLPIHSETIKLGATDLGNTKGIHKKSIQRLRTDVIEKINQQEANTSAHIKVYILGGGSLIAHIADEMQNDTLDVAPAVLGHPLVHEGLQDKELRLYAHAIGSALRMTSLSGGRTLVAINELDTPKRKTISLSQFKQRTVLLTIIFLLLLVGLILLIIFTKSGDPTPPPASITNSVNAATQSNQALDVFTLQLTDETTPSFVQSDYTTSETTIVETTGHNNEDIQVVAQKDITTAEQRLQGILLQQLEDYFNAAEDETVFTLFAPTATRYSSSANPAANEQSETVTIETAAQGFAIAFSKVDIETLVHTRLGNDINIISLRLSLPSYSPDSREGTIYIRTTYTH